MAAKILFVFLVGCAVVFASPIKRDDTKVEDEQLGEISFVESMLKKVFGTLLDKLGGAIKDSLEVVFKKLSDRLDTKEYRDTIEELTKILQTVFDDEDKIDAEGKDKELIEQGLKKVATNFESLLEDALHKIQHDSEEKVDAHDFQVAVNELKQIVQKIYSN